MIDYGPWKIGGNGDVLNRNVQSHYLGEDVWAYREAIEPKRETVTLWTRVMLCGSIDWARRERAPRDNIRLTYETIDGEPDFSKPIQWEKAE